VSFVFTIKRESAWKFETFGSGGISIVVSGTVGTVELTDPGGKLTSFWYGGIGAGPSGGLRLPKFGKVKLKGTGTVAPTWFKSTGVVLVTDNCPGDDLTISDLRGVCAFVEAGAGLIGGGSGLVMLAGLRESTSWWQKALSGVSALYNVYSTLNSARAVIPMAGLNVGVQAGWGVTGYIGFMW
jgi:hypothetical protein